MDHYIDTGLTLISLAFFLAGLIVSFATVWRTQSKLRVFLRFITGVVFLHTAHVALDLLGVDNYDYWPVLARIWQMGTAILFVCAMIYVYQIVLSLEKRK